MRGRAGEAWRGLLSTCYEGEYEWEGECEYEYEYENEYEGGVGGGVRAGAGWRAQDQRRCRTSRAGRSRAHGRHGTCRSSSRSRSASLSIFRLPALPSGRRSPKVTPARGRAAERRKK